MVQVHVQSDPAGRLIVTGEPEQLDNPWGVTPFKKVCQLFTFYPDDFYFYTSFFYTENGVLSTGY